MALSLEPGYLDFDNLPDTNFTCVGKVIGGYYADLEANCQMFHVCTIGQADEPMDIRFLCLNGTVFDQETRVCERIDEVDCSKSEQFYSLNLELYGNSGPILEEFPEVAQETEPPSIIIKSTTSTTTMTTTTTKKPTNRPTSPHYYTTIRPPTVTTATNKPKVVSTHHFPVNAPDIRFNPEEINISLNPGAPPDIRTKHFLSQSYSDSSQDIEDDNVNSDNGHSVKVQKPERLHVSSSTSPKSVYAMENNHNQNLPQNSENDFGFSEEGYQTELPQQRQQQFLIQTNSFRHSQSFPPNVEHNANQYHHQHFHSTTAKQENHFYQDPTTLRTVYLHSLKPPEIHQHHHYTHHHRTEKPPQRVQIPIPLLPTLPPLTFSSPAPFTLQRHFEAKRYTKDHQAPPRIIISASASVSDASGRRLNYSLGTIGAAQILQAPPSSYDDYKDSDVGLDPFYHDVPKLNQKRRKRRSTEQNEEKINPFDVIKNEKEAVEVLKFLFTWYQSHQATATVPPVTSPVTADLIHKINHELAADSDSTLLTDSSEIHFTNSKESTSTESLRPGYENSELFKKNGRYSIVGGYKNLISKSNLNRKSTFKNSAAHSEKHSDNTRDGKNLEMNDFLTELNPDMYKLQEKMDDAEVTVVKDLKESYLNPYDYVDDNYEGVDYKKNSPNSTKENNTIYNYLPKKDLNNITNHDENKNVYLNPAAVSELYKYFNVNHDSATEKSKAYVNIEDNNTIKNKNTEIYTPETTNNEDQEIIEPKVPLENISILFNHTENLNDSVKFTEENVLSEVYKNDEILSSSTTSTTSKTTTTVATERPTSKRHEIRRGRGRQRQRTDHYQDRQNNFNTLSSSTESYNSKHALKSKGNDLEKTGNHNLTEQSTPARQQNRLVRKRGRSRFNDFYSSTSTTSASPLAISTTVQNILVNENTEENPTTDPQFSLLPPLIKSIKEADKTDILQHSTAPTLEDANFSDAFTKQTSENYIFEQPKIFEANTSEQILDSFSEESKKDSPLNIPDTTFGKSENKSSEDILSHDSVHDIPDINDNTFETKNEEILTTQPNQFDDFVTENDFSVKDIEHGKKDIYTDEVLSNYETPSPRDSEIMQVENSTKTFIDEEIDHFSKNMDIVETATTTDSKQIPVETSTTISIDEDMDYFSKTKDTPELKPVIEIPDDPTYLIKLLRYFAEPTITPRQEEREEEKITTEIPAEFYTPLTETQVRTTEDTIVQINRQTRTRNKGIEQKRGWQRVKHRNSSRVSTTSLPTLRDIYEHSNRSKENENNKIGNSEENVLGSLTSIDVEKNGTQAINDATSLNVDQTTQLTLNVPNSELEENIQLKPKSELIERLTLIEENLEEKLNNNPVTNTPIVDTTATTPFISFEHPESFGTTISDVTYPTKSIDDSNTKELTQMFETSTEPNHFSTQSEPTEKTKHYYSFYEDVFVVPELTEKSSYTTYTEASKNWKEHTEKPFILESTSTPSTDKLDHEIPTASTKEVDHLLPETTQTFYLDLTSPTIKNVHDPEGPLIIKLEDDLSDSIDNQNILHTLDLSTAQPDVEIQKSISLPVSVLQTTFDISHDINAAQDINDLIPTSQLSEAPSTLRTTENLHEYIQDIEVSTKSVMAKDDQAKLGFTEDYHLTATEIVPTTLITTENPELINEATTLLSVEEHVESFKYSVVPEVQHNATEILFVKDTESPRTSNNDSTTSLPTSVPSESPGMVNSSHLLEVVVETTTTEPVTTILATTRKPYRTRKTRPTKRRPYNNPKHHFGRHRFSTELFTNKPPKHNTAQYKQNLFTAPIDSENITEAPLHRSATPTRSEVRKVSLHTTPLSSKSSRRPTKVSKHYVFNCFGKDKNKFYADPRDCRVFHYCTQGYSKNQLLDLKFVCDQKTFFDDDKLLCTKVKPTRCL